VYDKINEFYQLNQDESCKEPAIEKMNYGIKLYEIFFKNNEYGVNFELEKNNIISGSDKAFEIIREIIGDVGVLKVVASAQEYRQGNARDVYIELSNNETLNFSLKTDKSGKIALFEGQTSDIFEKVYKRYFNLSIEAYENIKLLLFNTIDEYIIFEKFDNVAGLTQQVFINQLGLINGDVGLNNLGNALATNDINLKYLIRQLMRYERSDDNSIVIGVNRLTGDLLGKTLIDNVDFDNFNLSDFTFLPCKPRKYRFGTEPGIKYKGKAIVSFQAKHKRGRNPSLKFSDITIRLKTK
ncbi:MAG: hypothetical protein Q8K26_05360, partial [Candidatus Gracilibacteria bacterium]|nr:hypothetical protein [Candidatus Gracilibacteria bacterium]